MRPAVGTVMVIAKEPVPGRVKTRLTPPLTPARAAEVATAALLDTLEEVATWPAQHHVLLLDGQPTFDVPRHFEVRPQTGGGLDERLADAFAGVEGSVLLVGMDTPQLRFDDVAPALAPEAWSRHDCWIGPADDGGFWALGFARPDPALLRGVPMSTPHTYDEQCARLVSAGLRVGVLDQMRDVDTAADAAAVAARCRGRRFGYAWARVGESDTAA